jgi:hypothetical protein
MYNIIWFSSSSARVYCAKTIELLALNPFEGRLKVAQPSQTRRIHAREKYGSNDKDGRHKGRIPTDNRQPERI